jgi:CRP/FNR family transcriptional regulator
MYIILDGKVKVIQTTEDGKEILLAIHQSGDSFGEMSLIDGKTSPATVLATENSAAAIVSKKDFYFILETQKKVLNNLLLLLCSRHRESWEKIQMLNYKNASHRVKILFLMLSDKYGEKTPEGITLNIKLTHQEMAEMTGMTRETVTRVIDKWQRDGEINVLKNKFIHMRPNFLTEGLKPIY